MSELALQLIEENKRTRDTFLDLGKCGLKNELPKELAECVWLESLCLGLGYFDHTLNDWIVSKNNKPDNQFKGNELVILQNLTRLGSLYVFDNQIQDISFLQSLTQLQFLDLRENQIQDYSFLQSLTQLRFLYLRVNQSQDISFLQNLTQLQLLNLNNNQIHDYSFLQSLTQLQTLDLRNNQIKDCSFLQALTQLQSLNLSENQIQDYSFLQALTQLQSLDLSSNQIQDYSFLQALTQLQSLDLSSNQIQNISFLQTLSQLQTLDLRYNQIKDTKPLLFLIKKGLKVDIGGFENDGILLDNNPITTPPIEIVEQGREAIIRYFERIDNEGHDFIFEAKLTLVGDGGSGKTSLQKRILDEKAELPAGSDRTRGIKVYVWEFNDAHAKTYTVHIWDFGGQDVYYPVHRFFLTENSVYILMASTRFQAHNFEYWIPTIYQFGGNSPIVLVQTCDGGNQKDWTDIKPFYGVTEYNLKPIYKINLPDDNWGLRNLKGFIQHQITELPHIGKAVPKSWVKVRERLIEKAKMDDYISLEKFSELCRETNKDTFSKTVDIEDLAHFLHDLGIILWYAKKGLLRNFVILKPEWAMNAVYKIIDDTLIQEQNGVIYEADFTRIWGEDTYRTKINELKLMLQVFKIAFPKQQQKDDYIIPARLNPIPDAQLWTNHENALRLEYHFDFMPRGIVNQLSADLSSKIASDESVWSDAVILKEGNSYAQILEEVHKKKILIKAKGFDARGLMVLIMNSISNIIKEYRGVVPLLRVPCSCSKCQTLEKPNTFEYQELIDFLEEGKESIRCYKSDTKLSIQQLLYSLGLEHKEKGKEKPVKNTDKESINGAKKIFICYSQYDNEYKEEFKKHLISLKKQKLVEIFDDGQLALGSKWDEVLKQKIDECDYFVCLVSVDFLNVEYIYEEEMPRAMKLGKTVIPIIIKPCDWVHTPIKDFDTQLGDINAHNKGTLIGLTEEIKNGKAMPKKLEKEERDAMWLGVVNQIRTLIKKDN